MSLFLHFILLTTLGLMLASSPKGTGEAVDRPVGVAIVHKLADRERYVDARETQTREQSESTETASASESQAAAPPADFSPPIDLAGVLKAMESIPSPNSGTGLSGESDLGEDAFGSGRAMNSDSSGAEATTTVFGISGSGTRFVYVFDRSDSMNGYNGRPLRAAKTELLRSLRSLSERQQFQLVFYNDKSKPFQPAGMPLQLLTGDSSNVSRAENYIRSINAFGGTKHSIALKLALRMSPDVIFFLTDARIPRLSASELSEIHRRAVRAGTTIHAIEFGADAVEPLDSFLRDLAAQNHGEYRYIDVRSLGKAGPAQPRPKN